MTLSLQQLIALLPLAILGVAVVALMLLIAWRRSHGASATLSMIGFGAAIASLWFVYQGGPVDVTSLIRIDFYAVFYMCLVLFAGLGTCILAYPWLEGYPDNKEEFYLLLLIAALGGILLAGANHLATLFLGVELISLPLFGMIGYAFQRESSLEASIKYTILSAAASSFLLFGIGMIYAHAGDLSFALFGKVFASGILNAPLMLMGLGFLIVGLGFKLSLVPFHLWTPDVYQGAPAPVSAFLATASKIAILCVLLRLFLYIPLDGTEAVRWVLGLIAFISILFGNLMALSQTNIKRLLGYSSIAHLGYLLVAVVAVNQGEMSVEAVGIYLAGYLFSNLGAFGVVSLLSSPYRGPDVDALSSYRGLFWYRPMLAVAMTVMMLSLAGIPLTLGFLGKFYIIMVAVHAHLWWLAAGVIIGSAMGLYYYLRAAVSLYAREDIVALPSERANDWHYRVGAVVVIFSTIFVMFFGIWPQPLISLVQFALPM